MLSEEPFITTVIAVDTCDVLKIPREAVLDSFQRLPANIAQMVVGLSLERREMNLPQTYPITTNRLRLSLLFRDLGEDAARRLLARLEPKVIPRGKRICEKGKISHEMFFIRRGIAGFRRFAESQVPSVSSDGTKAKPVAQDVVLRSGSTYGEREMMFRDRYTCSVVALSNVDVYVLTRTDLDDLLESAPGAKELVLEAANVQRTAELNKALQQGRRRRSSNSFISQPDPPNPLLEKLKRIPLLDLFAPDALYDELHALLQPRVFNARQTVVSATQECDRLLIMARGVVRVQDNGGSFRSEQYFHTGECIGYTCLLHHRWAYTLVAQEPADIWEIPRPAFVALLRKYGIYTAVLGATIQVMQPLYIQKHRAVELEEYVRALPAPNSLPYLRTPNMHPVSLVDSHCMYPHWKANDNATLDGYGRQNVLKAKTQEPGKPRSSSPKPPATVSTKETLQRRPTAEPQGGKATRTPSPVQTGPSTESEEAREATAAAESVPIDVIGNAAGLAPSEVDEGASVPVADSGRLTSTSPEHAAKEEKKAHHVAEDGKELQLKMNELEQSHKRRQAKHNTSPAVAAAIDQEPMKPHPPSNAHSGDVQHDVPSTRSRKLRDEKVAARIEQKNSKPASPRSITKSTKPGEARYLNCPTLPKESLLAALKSNSPRSFSWRGGFFIPGPLSPRTSRGSRPSTAGTRKSSPGLKAATPRFSRPPSGKSKGSKPVPAGESPTKAQAAQDEPPPPPPAVFTESMTL